MDAGIVPHVEYNVSTGDHNTLLTEVTNALTRPNVVYHVPRNGINQVVIRVRSSSSSYRYPNGLRLYMQRDTLYITGFSSGQIYEFRGHKYHQDSIELPFDSRYPAIPDPVLGRHPFETAVMLLTQLCNLARPRLSEMQNPIFVIIMHLAEAVRLTSVSNLLATAHDNENVSPVNDLIARQFNGWKAISLGIKDYTGPKDVSKEEYDMVHGFGDWGSEPHARVAMDTITRTPRLCAYLIKVKWNYSKTPETPVARGQRGQPGRTSRRRN